MALLPILEFPDPRLRTKAVRVGVAEVVSSSFQTLLDDMFETMYAAPGIGLAATQVNVHQRFMVVDVSEEKMRLWSLLIRRSSPGRAIRCFRKAVYQCLESMPM